MNMSKPEYIGIEGARRALEGIGINLSHRQVKRAADPDSHGKRKLPFFINPIDKRLKIDKSLLLKIYSTCQDDAKTNAHHGFHNEKKNNAAN